MTVEQIIEEAIREYKLSESQQRRRHVRKLVDYYCGSNTSNYIEQYFDSDAFREVPCYEANFTKRFINKMSRIYTVGANRNVSDAYDNLTVMKDARMKHVERMTRLIGTIATQVVFIDGDMPHFDYRPVYYFDVHLGDNPFKPEAITYPVLMNSDDVSHTEKLKYAYWDKGMYALYDEDGNILEEYEHGYGVLPFVFTHRENQLDSFFVDGADDIVSCNEHVNITMTELQLGLRFQMFGQPYVTGLQADKRLERAGSDTILDLPEGSVFDIVAPEADLQSVIETVKFQVDLVAQNNHLYVQFAQDGGEVPSGIALKIKDLERFEDYQDDIELWKMYEHELYHVEKEIADYNGIRLPESLKLDFNEPEYPKTMQDQILWDNHRLQNNLITRAKLMVEYNDDLSLQEAEALVAENKAKNEVEIVES
jgi:hypothetical protein|tara:strand:+ start:49 stop:1320 length:1272 start_codon:yes stop_codon:yes gene_type:complete